MNDKPVCCPQCGGTELHVQLPAVFLWNGEDLCCTAEDLRSSEFPIEDDAAVICNSCEWSGKVSDLLEVKR